MRDRAVVGVEPLGSVLVSAEELVVVAVCLVDLAFFAAGTVVVVVVVVVDPVAAPVELSNCWACAICCCMA